MKNFKALIAMIVAMMVMVLPMGALAAQTDAAVIQIANPIITMDGQEIANLDGLALQLASMTDERTATLIVDLFAANQNAASAMLQIDNTGENVVGLLGGMSSAYMVNSYELGEKLAADMMAGLDEETSIMVNSMVGLVNKLETWTLPAELAAVIENHAADITVGTPYTGTNAQGTTLNYTQFSGDLTSGIIDLLRAVEADSLINEALTIIDPYASLAGMADSFQQAGLAFTVEGAVGFDDYGYAADIDVRLNIFENNTASVTLVVDMAYDMSSNLAFAMNISALDNTGAAMVTFTSNVTTAPGSFMASANMKSVDGESMNLIANGMANDAMASFNMNLDATDYYGDTTTANLYANATPTDNGMTFNANLNANDGYDNYRTSLNGSYEINGSATAFTATLTEADSYSTSTMELSFGGDYYTGAYNFKLGVKDDYDDMYIAGAIAPYAELPAGMNSSNQVSLEFYDGYNVVGITCDINTLASTVDTDSFYINPVAAINLLTMDDAQMAAAQAEVEAVLQSVIEAISAAYPELGM